jgi:hypothetical protein
MGSMVAVANQRAELRGRFFLAVAVDSAGDVFDTWHSGQGEGNTSTSFRAVRKARAAMQLWATRSTISVDSMAQF